MTPRKRAAKSRRAVKYPREAWDKMSDYERKSFPGVHYFENEIMAEERLKRFKNAQRMRDQRAFRKALADKRKVEETRSRWRKRKELSRRNAVRVLSEGNERVVRQKLAPGEFLSQEEKGKCIRDFENKCMSLSHGHCRQCHCVSLNIKLESNDTCVACRKEGADESYWLSQNLLPVWYKDAGTPVFTVPDELSSLTIAEKMLIQQYQIFLPVHHIRNGTMGLKGHVCSFPQQLGALCTTLPRLPRDVDTVKFRKLYNKEIGGDETVRIFKVRKNAVIMALRWLKKHNRCYKHINIKVDNLDWIDGSESMLPASLEMNNLVNQGEALAQRDMGPSPGVCVHPRRADGVDDVTAFGVLVQDAPIIPSKEDRDIVETIEDCTRGDKNVPILNWPSVSDKAVCEYDDEAKIFVGAFPWLFPGGYCDFSDIRRYKINAQQWAKRMIMFEDGRFVVDKMFCFFVLNYIVRRRNQASGNFFVNKFNSTGALDIEDLKQKISEGNKSFISEISYFTKEVTGSDGYWRSKRSELYSWINHHMEFGNGRPDFFITLSCAEYWWPDIKRLVEERVEIATGVRPDLEQKSIVQAMNDWSSVVQECFQIKVKVWLETVGKSIFGIQHYWVRYEFAPSRGQIHAHLLAISDNVWVQMEMHRNRHDEDAQARILSSWAASKFGLVARHPQGVSFEENLQNHPCARRFSDVPPPGISRDADVLKEAVAMHECSAYCLRETHAAEKRDWCKSHNRDPDRPPRPFLLRTCRYGHGIENTAKRGDTPGLPHTEIPYMENSACGFKKLRVTRDHAKVNQVSLAMLQSWRANCDLQIMIYDSDPSCPDLGEIARVTDYVVGYACKGAKTCSEEKDQMAGFINKFSDDTGDSKSDLKRLARRLLNQAATNRVISKQECLVMVLKLDFVTCSDKFTSIGVGGRTFISASPGAKTTRVIERYATRTSEEHMPLSLHQYFHSVNSQSPGTKKPHWFIPHYTGASSRPVHPPTRGYANTIFKIHRPWSKKYDYNPSDWRVAFERFINNKSMCPRLVTSGYIRAIIRYIDNTEFVETKSKQGEMNKNNDEEMDDFLALCTQHKTEEDGDLCFDRGLNGHDWSSSVDSGRETNGPGQTWLLSEISEEQSASSGDLELPTKKSGTDEFNHYELGDLQPDQADVAAYVLRRVNDWVYHDFESGPFPCVFMTVRGKGGSGKTVLLKTLTSIIRRMFNSKTAAHVCGPTGASACHAGGYTFHHLFGMNQNNKHDASVSAHTSDSMKDRLLDTVLLQLDERSMLGSATLARMECVARHCAHGGFNAHIEWGGIPIVIMYGDDYQLPSVEKGVTSIPLPGHADIAPAMSSSKMIIEGNELFLRFAENVMNLPVIKRQDAKDVKLAEQLERVRNDRITDDDIENTYEMLHLGHHSFSPEKVEEIMTRSLKVFANVAPKQECNIRGLFQVHSASNPVAKLRATYRGHSKLNKAVKKHFARSNSPSLIWCCIGAWVNIAGRNLMPKWGLYNGGRGRIVEIHFRKGQNPNEGHLPGYIVVDMPSYTGPIWDEKNHSHVPIPMVEERCQKQCCSKRFFPLELSFATTIHKMQGLEVGPTPPGGTPRAAECMVVDIGLRSFEQICMGLAYVAVSRASTMGGGDPMASAIYFMGKNINNERLQNMTRCRNHDRTLKAKRRDAWIGLLEKNTRRSGLSKRHMVRLFRWAENVVVSGMYNKRWIVLHSKQRRGFSLVP